jgi:hypothetical protein
MDTIGKMKLCNDGGFVAIFSFMYGPNFEYRCAGSGPIILGKCATAEPDMSYDGAQIKMYVYVTSADQKSDKIAPEVFTWLKGSPKVATYKISGVLYNDKLVYQGVS